MPTTNTKKSKFSNESGKFFEELINFVLIKSEYTFKEQDKFTESKKLKKPIFSRQFIVGKSIYDKDWKCDFILYHPEEYPDDPIIEAKWQSKSGTTDEKHPYVLENFKKHNSHKAIIIIGGKGHRSGALSWLKNQVNEIENFIGAYSTDEFIAKIMQNIIKKNNLNIFNYLYFLFALLIHLANSFFNPIKPE